MRKILLTISVFILFSTTVIAQEFTVSDIRIEGLQRITASSVFGLLNVNVGDQLNDFDIANIVRDIYASDYFDNIEVLRDEDVLIIRLQERPSISEINIDGNKLIPTDALIENMDNMDMSVGQTLKPSILEGLQIGLESEYVAQGLYGASVDVEVVDQPRNRVAININIDEGDASKIIHINIVGNHVFDDEELLDLFELKTSHFTSFFRKDDRYAREKINGDIERLTSYYMDQGYINFEVTSTQVSVSPDRSQVYITINIQEGDVYTVDEVELAGDLVDSEALLRLVTQVRPGQIFSQILVTSSSDFMTQLLGNRGYFFAEVEGVPIINEEEKTVSVTFFVEPGNRTYVNRINFYGNTNTVDEVLRREMRQMEGASASTVAMEQSKVRLQQLGYFAEVEYETEEVPGTSDQIDINFTLEEQPSGTIGGSIGYAQVQGLVLSANLQQNNFFGTGKRVGVGINTSAFSTNYSFNFQDPYYTIDGVSRGFAINYTTSDYAELNLAAYSTDQFGMQINFGYPIGETQRLGYSFGYTNTQIDVGYGPVQEIKASPELYPGLENYISEAPRFEEYQDPDTGIIYPISDAVVDNISFLPPTAFNQRQGFIDREGSKFNDFTFSISWSRSTLNQGLFPTAGSTQNISLEMAIPGSDLSFYRLRFFSDHYKPIWREFILHTRIDAGYGDGYGGTEQLPFFRNFYAGGLGSIRGFEMNTLGPRSTAPRNYDLAPTTFYRDENGDFILDANGLPILNNSPFGPRAYLLNQAIDEDGNPVFDSTGLPVYEPKISSSPLYVGIPQPFGGNIQFTGTVEMLFPIPFIKDRSRIRSSLFFDAGNVFSNYCTSETELRNNCNGLDINEFRSSAGIAVSWFSGAFGIMTFSLAKPFNASFFDEEETFQFTIGNTF